MSFHIVSVCSESSFGAIPHCEYLVHNSHAVIHSLCTLELTVERHFCSIFKHKCFRSAGMAFSPSTHRRERRLGQPLESKHVGWGSRRSLIVTRLPGALPVPPPPSR